MSYNNNVLRRVRLHMRDKMRKKKIINVVKVSRHCNGMRMSVVHSNNGETWACETTTCNIIKQSRHECIREKRDAQDTKNIPSESTTHASVSGLGQPSLFLL